MITLPRKIRGPAAGALAALFLAGLALFRFDASLAGLPRADRATPVYRDAGENLLHRHLGQTTVSLRMPSYGVWEALLLDHASPPARAVALYAAVLLQLALVFALGLLLGSPAGAFLGAAAFALLRHGAYTESASLQPFFSVFVTAAAAAAVWRANKPVPARGAWLGAAVGASLLVRSTLVLLPPVLAAWEWLSARRAPRRDRAASLALLLVVPYLFLLPWIGMNWKVQRRFIPLESESRDSNVAMGAAGLVTGVYGEWREALDEPPPEGGSGAVMLWAARVVARHPLRYARACVERLAFVVLRHPWLYASAFLALALSWGFPAYRAAAVFAAYFLGVHCLMTVIPVYFLPLLPLLVAAAAAGAGRLVRAPDLDEGSASYRAGVLILKGALAVLLLWSAYLAALTVRYAGAGSIERLTDAAALDREVAAHPGDPWLRLERARTEMDSDRDAAARDLGAAMAARPDDAGAAGALAWAKLLQGDPRPLLAMPAATGASDADELEALKVSARLASGDRAGALAQYRAARARFVDSAGIYREGSLAESEAVLRLHAARDARFDAFLAEVAARHRAPDEAAAALGALSALLPESRPLRRALALSLHAAKKDARALSLLDALARQTPEDASLWKDRGICEYALGRTGAARRDLKRALELEPGLASAALSLGFVESSAGRCAAARDAYRSALAAPAAEGEGSLRPMLADALSRLSCD